MESVKIFASIVQNKAIKKDFVPLEDIRPFIVETVQKVLLDTSCEHSLAAYTQTIKKVHSMEKQIE